MAKRRIETRASQTAGYTCFSRACATREPDPNLRGPDILAEVILPSTARFMLNFVPLRKFLMRRMFPPGIYEYVIARTKVMDAAFLEVLDADFSQIVLLGAGFDTRALRFASRNHGTKIFELDVATTQEPKIEILHKQKLTIPSELVFVSIDFDREDIFERLSRTGFKDGQRTLFLWEGVSMYLSAEAVDGTLAFIREHSAPSSRVVFDYLYASVLRRENRFYGEREIYKTISRVGEGWTFGLEEGEIEPFLTARGFGLVSHYSPSELEQKYLMTEGGARLGPINGTHCIVVASVK
jgi:methyltransferase (TIGR00027 family)